MVNNALTTTIDDEDKFFIKNNKIVLRKIFYGGQQLDEFEINEIRKFKDYLQENKLEIPEK